MEKVDKMIRKFKYDPIKSPMLKLADRTLPRTSLKLINNTDTWRDCQEQSSKLLPKKQGIINEKTGTEK